MKVLVMHDSRFGNGLEVANSMAEGLKEAGHEAHVAEAAEVKRMDPAAFGAFALGTPIRVGSPTWRAGGAVKGLGKKCPGRPAVGWVTQADTNMYGVPRWEHSIRAAGLSKLMEGRGFNVKGMRGPLADGELARAREFGMDMGKKLGQK